MNKKITVIKKVVYGRDLYYPACPLSEIFCILLRKQSLSPKVLETLTSKGIEIEVKTG